MTEQEKLELIVKTLDNKRGEDIQALKIGDLTILADYFIIANGTSNTHACRRSGISAFPERRRAAPP